MNKGLETNSTLSHYRIVFKIARLRDEIHTEVGLQRQGTNKEVSGRAMNRRIVPALRFPE